MIMLCKEQRGREGGRLSVEERSDELTTPALATKRLVLLYKIN